MSNTAVIQEFLCGHITFAILQSQFNLQQYMTIGIIATIISIILYCKFYICNKSAIFFGVFIGFVFPYFCQLWYTSALMPFMLWHGTAKKDEGPTLCLTIMGIFLIAIIAYAITPKKHGKKERIKIIWTDKKRTLFGLPLSFTTYELDEERLYIRTGFFTRVEDEIRLYRITDTTLIQTLGQRIFGVGTIHCNSSDASRKEFHITSVKNPPKVREMLSNLIEEQREQKRVYTREIMNIDEEM